MSGMRIRSVEDSQPSELAHANSNDDEHDAEQGAGPVYIHDSVENNDEYAEHIEYSEYADDEPSA